METKRLTKTYGSTVAVHELNLTISKGSLHSLVGPNGAGKSTTLKLLCGLLKPTYGTASVLGYDVETELERVKALVGYVPENPSLYRALTVGEYLGFIGELYMMPPDEFAANLRKYVRLFRLEDRLNHYIGSLSKGWLQRVVLASTLLREPALLLLDEPFYGLDPVGSYLLKNELREHRNNGTTILLSSHMLDIAEKLSDTVTIINHGRAVVTGTLEALRKDLGASTSLEQIFLQATRESWSES